MNEYEGIDYNKLIEVYLDLRKCKEEIKDSYERKIKPIEEKMEKIESFLNGELNRLGLKNISTNKGTVLRTTWTKVNITDWEKVTDYIVENNRFDMLEKRLAKTVVLDTLSQNAENGLPPVPGVMVESGLKVSIRKA